MKSINNSSDKSAFAELKMSEDKFFNFAIGPSLKYCTVLNGASNVSFNVAVKENFTLTSVNSVNDRATAPCLVLLNVDPEAVTPFSLLLSALSDKLATPLEWQYQNKVYLNTSRQVFKQLQTLTSEELERPQLLFTVELRHIILRENIARIKFLLVAVDEHVDNCEEDAQSANNKRKSSSKKNGAKKQRVNIEPTDVKEVEESDDFRGPE
jgi:hypothetical protein